MTYIQPLRRPSPRPGCFCAEKRKVRIQRTKRRNQKPTKAPRTVHTYTYNVLHRCRVGEIVQPYNCDQLKKVKGPGHSRILRTVFFLCMYTFSGVSVPSHSSLACRRSGSAGSYDIDYQTSTYTAVLLVTASQEIYMYNEMQM